MAEEEAGEQRNRALDEVARRYETELMNPKEALSLGSVSRIVMPGSSRRVIGQNLAYLMRRYEPCPMSGPQREFE
jgi:acetyl-CoA carboxylase carboxyltransferase component